jgi:hypothetical protein
VQGEQQRGGSADVADGEDDAGDEQRERDGAARILDLIAHGRGGLNGAEGEEDGRPEDGIVEGPVRDKAGSGYVDGGPQAPEGEGCQEQQCGERQKAAECADVVEPLAGLDAADVEQGNKGQPEDGKGHVVERIAAESVSARAEGEEHRGGSEVKHAGEEGQVAHPVSPGADEAGEVAEGLAGPDVDAAFFRMARGEFHDRAGKGDEEAEERGHPDDEYAGTGAGGGCDPAYAEHDDHVEEHEVAEADAALEGRGVGH